MGDPSIIVRADRLFDPFLEHNTDHRQFVAD